MASDTGCKHGHVGYCTECRQADDLARVMRERDAYKQEADNFMNIVCSQPACRAAIVRRDDGSRVCAAGHPGRWVTIDRLMQAEAREAALRADYLAVAEAMGFAEWSDNGHVSVARPEVLIAAWKKAERERIDALLAKETT